MRFANLSLLRPPVVALCALVLSSGPRLGSAQAPAAANAPAAPAQAPGSAQAPAAPAQTAPSAQLPFVAFALDNGMKVILSQDRALPRVAVNLWYHVGPVNEPKGRSGFAHLFEHLMFEGSKNVGRQFDTLMEGMGASGINGTTNWDRTNYFETVPSEHLATALWIESDRMAFMSLSPERLEAQRAIVKNERRQSFENSPYGLSDLELLNTLFPEGHPYHGAVIGSMQDLSAARMRDVHDFYRTYYAPNNATLTLVGDFEVERAKSLIEKYFASIPAREVPKTEHPLTPPLGAPVKRTVHEDVELLRVTKAWITPPAYTPADPALRVATAILATGKASRLYRSLVVDQNLASEVSAYVDANRLCSMVGVDAKASSDTTAEKLQAALEAALADFAKNGPSERELRRAKKALLVELFGSLEHLNGPDGESGRAGLLQRFSYYTGDPGYLERWVQSVNAVTREGVESAVQQWLDERHAATVVTLPKPGAPVEAKP
ncbi:MAG TPA: pitrilysin family protein [Polyangiaceae bacterium]|nr:pitrilysin family protein [Polyangiaceae bacterium]